MAKEHIPAGSEVVPGIYRSNACANRYECTLEEQELPMYQVCDSISWRAFKLANDAGGRSNEKS